MGPVLGVWISVAGSGRLPACCVCSRVLLAVRCTPVQPRAGLNPVVGVPLLGSGPFLEVSGMGLWLWKLLAIA